MFEMFDRNDREVKLVCLFHNGKEAVVDFLAYLQSNETIPLELNEQIQKVKTLILSTHPKYFGMYPTESERICTDLQPFKSLLPSSDQQVFNSIIQVITLGHIISNTNETTTWCTCYESTWRKFWDDQVSHIVKILSYLNVNHYLDERDLFQKCIEVENILYKEMRKSLYQKYGHCLNEHYEYAKNLQIIDSFLGRYESKFEFTLQFQLEKLGPKPTTGALYWLGRKRHYDCFDIGLHSDVTLQLSNSVDNIFYDKLGDFNTDRYMVSLYHVDREVIDIKGKNLNEDVSLYECVTKAKRDEIVPSGYRYCMSAEGEIYWKSFEACIKKAVKEKMDIDVHVGLNAWCYERDGKNITSSVFISKKASRWNVDELYELDEVIAKCRNELDDLSDDVYVASLQSFYHIQTKQFNFNFQVRSYSPGLTDIIQGIIPFAQELILEIQPY